MAHTRDFGWWIQSTDEEIYGPVTKTVLQDYLKRGVISANTSIRHCTVPEFSPVLDQGIIEGDTAPGTVRTGDRMGEEWPRRKKQQLELAESEIECANHRRPAILTCIRCLAPYCYKCSMKKRASSHFLCKPCLAGTYNRRFLAYFLDNILLLGVTYGVGLPLMFALGPEESGPAALNLIGLASTVGFVVRDPVCGGAGPGKRLFSLRVVKKEDGESKLSYGQGLVRCFGHMIPFFNLVDGSRPSTDPLQRRYGDSWAKTRVLDTPAKLEKVRNRIRSRLQKKGIAFEVGGVMTQQDFARLG